MEAAHAANWIQQHFPLISPTVFTCNPLYSFPLCCFWLLKSKFGSFLISARNVGHTVCNIKPFMAGIRFHIYVALELKWRLDLNDKTPSESNNPVLSRAHILLIETLTCTQLKLHSALSPGVVVVIFPKKGQKKRIVFVYRLFNFFELALT